MVTTQIKFLFFFFVLSTSYAHAQTAIIVQSKDGQALSNIVVSVHATAKQENNKTIHKANEQASQIEVMNQIDQQFVPHILLVKQGTTVTFPNRDSVKHHVYSFSPAKTFEILLQEQLTETPIKFDTAGIVELGCNIHDWMLGYIYVTDADIYGKTNQAGTFNIDLDEGEYTIDIWHPRLTKVDITKQHKIRVSAKQQKVVIVLESELLESLSEFDSVGGLDAYD
jgi:plastocyanin